MENNNYNNLLQLEWLAAADVIENLMLRLVLRPNYICKKQTSCNLTIKLILANNIDDRYNI